MADYKEFTTAAKNEPIGFTIDGEKYECVPVPPAAALTDVLVASAKDEDPAKAIKAILGFLDLVLTDDSAARVAARMRSKEHAVDFDTLVAVFEHLMEKIASGRPTGGSNGSATGSPPTGRPLTAIAPPEG